jgi:hypothetical protein
VLQNLEVAAPPLLGALHEMCGWMGEGTEADGAAADPRLLRLANGEGGGEEEEKETAAAASEPLGLRAARRRLARRLAEARGVGTRV